VCWVGGRVSVRYFFFFFLEAGRAENVVENKVEYLKHEKITEVHKTGEVLLADRSPEESAEKDEPHTEKSDFERSSEEYTASTDSGDADADGDGDGDGDGAGDGDGDGNIVEEVSSGPVEYSVATGKIEKTSEQIQQEEQDELFAQQLYEEELRLLQELQNRSTQQNPTLNLHNLQDPYHIPPPQKQSPNNKTPAHPPGGKLPTPPSKSGATKRPAANTNLAVDEKRSKNAIDDQLKEIRQMRQQQWHDSGGKLPTATTNRPGFNASFYNQMKEIRNKHNRSWRENKKEKKRVWTVSDLDAAIKQSYTDNSKPSAGDAYAVRVGKEALAYTNQFRKENKLPPLDWNSGLCTIGAQHSKNMAEHKVPFGHDGFNERMKQFPMNYHSAAENVAMSRGIDDVARTAVEGWIESPGHRKNLLSHSQYCGIGCYQGADGTWYLTQLFAG